MIPEIEKESPEKIKTFQEEQLKKQLQYVAQHSTFYKNLWEQRGINIQKIQHLEDLSQLPVTVKAHLQEHNKDFFCLDSSEIIDYASTSGTTGSPVLCGMSDKDLDRLAYNEAISFSCAGVQKGDIVQLMTTMDRQFMAGLAYFLGLRKLGTSIIRTGSGIPALQWESILNYHPKYLITVPSFLLNLIDYAEKNEINLSKTSVKAAICIGEPLRTQEFESSALTKRIQEKWDIQLYSTYASTEMATAFTECKYQQGGHQHPELIITEVLDNNNQPITNGDVGELTITTLGNENLPLVRYKTGDLVKIHTTPCKCGRNTPRIGPVIGRAKQMIKYKGTTLFPPAIHNTINHFKEISSHLILLKNNEVGNDDIEVKVVCSDSSKEFKQQLKEHFQAKIRVIPAIEFISAKEMQEILKKQNNRKPRYVIDQRK